MQGGAVSTAQAQSLALEGLLLFAFALFVSLIDFNFLGLSLTPLFLPAVAIYLWPQSASYNFSLWCIFLAGLFHDLASGQTVGVFALGWILVFLMVQSDPRERQLGFAQSWLQSGAVIGIAALLIAVIAALVMDGPPRAGSVILQALMSWALYPLIFAFYKLILRLFHNVPFRA